MTHSRSAQDFFRFQFNRYRNRSYPYVDLVGTVDQTAQSLRRRGIDHRFERDPRNPRKCLGSPDPRCRFRFLDGLGLGALYYFSLEFLPSLMCTDATMAPSASQLFQLRMALVNLEVEAMTLSCQKLLEVDRLSRPVAKSCFEFIDLPSHNKFWTVETLGNKLFVTYGKIGSNGATQVKSYASSTECGREAEKMISGKIKKGHVQVSSLKYPGAPADMLLSVDGVRFEPVPVDEGPRTRTLDLG